MSTVMALVYEHSAYTIFRYSRLLREMSVASTMSSLDNTYIYMMSVKSSIKRVLWQE